MTEILFSYRILLQIHGSDIETVEGVDTRSPRVIRADWIDACRRQAERGRRFHHQAQLADMQNAALGKKVEDGLETPQIEDVADVPEDYGTEEEQLCLCGRVDGRGYASVIAGLIVGIACDGAAKK